MMFTARLLRLARTADARIAPRPRVHVRRGEKVPSLEAQLGLHTEPWLNKLGHSKGNCVYAWRDSKMTEDLVKTLSGKDNLVEAQAWVGKLGACIRPVLAHKNARGWAIESYKKNWPRVNTDGDSSLSLSMRRAGEWVVQYEINLLNGDLSASSLHAVARSSGPPRHRRATLFCSRRCTIKFPVLRPYPRDARLGRDPPPGPRYV